MTIFPQISNRSYRTLQVLVFWLHEKSIKNQHHHQNHIHSSSLSMSKVLTNYSIVLYHLISFSVNTRAFTNSRTYIPRSHTFFQFISPSNAILNNKSFLDTRVRNYHSTPLFAMAKKFYAVAVGHKPGIYQSWNECEAQVSN